MRDTFFSVGSLCGTFFFSRFFVKALCACSARFAGINNSAEMNIFLKIVKDLPTFLTLFHGTYFFFCVVLIQVIIKINEGHFFLCSPYIGDQKDQ